MTITDIKRTYNSRKNNRDLSSEEFKQVSKIISAKVSMELEVKDYLYLNIKLILWKVGLQPSWDKNKSKKHSILCIYFNYVK